MPYISFFGTHRNALGESPLWDSAGGRLWWVDALAGEIHAADAGGRPLARWSYPQPVGSIGLATRGLVAAMADGFYAIDTDSGAAMLIRRVEADGRRLNDGKADRDGRFFSAQMRIIETAAGGRLWRLDRDGTAAPLVDGLGVGNAICFSPDGATLYVADSMDGLLRAYPYNRVTGALGERSDLVDCRAQGSGPDGATVDARGRIWVALVLAQAVACYSPEGELLQRIDLPIPYPSCPAFGGPDLATLYVTTIANSGHRLVTDHPDGGRILAINGLDAVGLPEGRYTPDNHNREKVAPGPGRFAPRRHDIHRRRREERRGAMDLGFDAADRAFRDEVREFFAQGIPAVWRTRVRAGLRLDPVDLAAYQRRLAERGWGAPTWPVEHGGTGWTPARQYIFWSEAAAADAPAQFHQGLELIGPIIYTYGNAEQKARYLPRILTLEDWWCQGYSEPGAGSDLAALSTRADRDGDDYVLNGQKMWTSYAHVADHCFVLARTSREAKRQQGISLILVDMTTPGLRIAPIPTMDEKYHTNELFLDDVRVPVANLVGEEGQGWGYGKVLLDRERMVTASTAIFLTQTLRGIRDAAIRRRVGGRPLIVTPGFAAKLAQLEIEVIALQTMVLRLMDDAARGAESGPRGSMVKLRWSQLTQAATALWVEALGPEAAHFAALDDTPLPPDLPYAVQGSLYARVTSIYGGTSEIQHDIIARRALGL